MKFGGVVDSTCKTLAYQWKFPDGTTDTSAHPSKAFDTAGPKTVTLEAWCDGCSAPGKSASVEVSVHAIHLTDETGKVISASSLAGHPDFVTFGNGMKIYHDIPQSVPKDSYQWVASGAIAAQLGHEYLGTPFADGSSIDANCTPPIGHPGGCFIFKPKVSAGSAKKIGSSDKAKPLAFDLKLMVNGKVIKTFTIEQNYRNALREEYNVFGYTPFPSAADFDGSLSLSNYPLDTRVYDAEDVPNGSHINSMVNQLQGQVTITSSYRNPFRQQEVSTTFYTRHVWSGAIDVDSETSALRTVWISAKGNANFPEVLVESDDKNLLDYLFVIYRDAVTDEIIRNSMAITSVKINGTAKGHSNVYTVVWEKSSNAWATVYFTYGTLCDNYCPIFDSYYQLSEDDWNAYVARNLHIQDTLNYEGGFKKW